MKKKVARVLSMVLVSGMLFSIAACNSEKKSKVVKISEDDPYFTDKTVVLYQPESTSDQVSVTNMIDLGDKFAVMLDIYLSPDDGMMGGPITTYSASGHVVMESEAILTDNFEEDLESTDMDIEDTDVASNEEGDGDEYIDDESEGESEDELEDEFIDMDEGIYDEGYEDEYYDDWSQYQKQILIFFDYDGNKLSEIDMSDKLSDPDAYFMSMTKDGKGNLLLCFQKNEYTEFSYKSSILLKTIDTEGQSVGQDIAIELGEYESAYSVDTDGEGHLIVQKWGERGGMLGIYDESGKLLFDIKPEGEYADFGGIYPINGELYVLLYQSDSMGVYKVDFEAKKLGAEIDASNLIISTPIITDDGVYLNKSSGIYTYDLDTGKEEQVMSWNDTDINVAEAAYSSVLPISKDKILISQSYYYGTMSYYGAVDTEEEIEPLTLTVLDRAAKNPHAGKTIMTLGGLNIGYDSALTEQILKFNKSDKEFRIEIADYVDRLDASLLMNDIEDSYEKALIDLNQKLYLDIANGDGPDLLHTSYNPANMDRYIAKGLLVDFYELAKDDDSFAKENFLPNILTAFEVDGKLYEMPISFVLSGWSGPERLIGSRTGWTFDEFNQFVDGLPSDTIVFANRTQKTMLYELLSASLGKFLDYEKSQATFSSEDFYSILELAKTLGSPISENEMYDEGNYVDEWELMSKGKLAMSSAYVYSPAAIVDQNSMFAEPVTFVGYPSESKQGLLCSSNGHFSIISTSSNQDGAWRFIKSMIDEDFQNSLAKQGYGIPVRASSFEKHIEEAVKQYEQMYSMYGDMGGYGMGNYELTDEDIELYREIVSNATVREQTDAQIMAIINEEAPAFFTGQKTAQDVAAIIDNRVKTILSERS